jgi:hypothetical protein
MEEVSNNFKISRLDILIVCSKEIEVSCGKTKATGKIKATTCQYISLQSGFLVIATFYKFFNFAERSDALKSFEFNNDIT